MKQCAVILVSYNVRHYLEQALHSVFRAAQEMDIEVFVVDNNSVDDSVSMVQESFPQVHLIQNAINVGFAKANNQAAKLANSKYILLLNPDTVVQEDTLLYCFQSMESNPDCGALGVQLIDGSGRYLPESKRGFPTPWVAFCKAFGLHKIFPQSRWLNGYYMGHLSSNEKNIVDVLCGAFMWIRKEAWEKTGGLDESFFMYGEDIDLSYRIQQAGFKICYDPGTRIIHYKGESTAKDSLAYVKMFYQAMFIFARKHFIGKSLSLYLILLNFGIHVRAGIASLYRIIKSLFFPGLDIITGLIAVWGVQYFWALYYFNDANAYPMQRILVNMPVYVLLWVGGIALSGGYFNPFHLRKLFRGVVWGTIAILVYYALLPETHRFSRMVILLSSIVVGGATYLSRNLVHLLKAGNLNTGEVIKPRCCVVGTIEEGQRLRGLYATAGVPHIWVGTIHPTDTEKRSGYLCRMDQLPECITLYQITQVIFCIGSMKEEEIMQWMVQLGPKIQYKILPEHGLHLMGSASPDIAGSLITEEVSFQIEQPEQRWSKRLLDIGISILMILLIPILFFIVKNKIRFFKNLGLVILGKKTWVSYHSDVDPTHAGTLPKIKAGVLSPSTVLKSTVMDAALVQHCNYLYARDYTTGMDVNIVLKSVAQLGQ